MLQAPLKRRRAELEALAYREAGTEFNLSSPQAVSDVLFERLKLAVPRPSKQTKLGYWSTSEEVRRPVT